MRCKKDRRAAAARHHGGRPHGRGTTGQDERERTGRGEEAKWSPEKYRHEATWWRAAEGDGQRNDGMATLLPWGGGEDGR
ncbi:hypothetical protein NL676_028585 [Syzygium grande]|nr:hypothetical protein NL676_028585 [Syzygium grande]